VSKDIHFGVKIPAFWHQNIYILADDNFLSKMAVFQHFELEIPHVYSTHSALAKTQRQTSSLLYLG
jgi:hypothetical protein